MNYTAFYASQLGSGRNVLVSDTVHERFHLNTDTHHKLCAYHLSEWYNNNY